MKDPAVLFFIDTWLSATAEMDSDTKGWYLDLILHQYDKKDLPNDIENLAKLAGVKFSEYERFKQVFEQVLKHKFEQNSLGRLENPIAKEIIRKREVFKAKRSDAGRVGYFIKYVNQVFKPKKELLKFIRDNVNVSDIDLKNEQMLKQMFEHMLKLYTNGDGNNNINNNWRTSFEIYIHELNAVFESLIHDVDFIKEQERFNPNIDIVLSLEKAKNNFWGTEAGWKHKKKSKTKENDWRTTFINAIAMNKVYKQHGQTGKQSPETKTGLYSWRWDGQPEKTGTKEEMFRDLNRMKGGISFFQQTYPENKMLYGT